ARVHGTRQGHDVFNRYSTVDRPPEKSPPPHSSGRKFKYRQRYSVKTRSLLISHDPPEGMKQYVRKPWTTKPESPVETFSRHKPKSKPKTSKSQRPVDKMNKKELVDAMSWEHPTRTLDIGTINANAKRALSKEFTPSIASSYHPRIKTCLRDTSRLATKAKRICQQALAQYVE
ncbi:hypothetical protein BGZ51_001152, partial [Haplosporangium sp. Z 767]